MEGSIDKRRFNGILVSVRMVSQHTDLLRLDDVTSCINAFLLDVHRWSVEQACFRGFPRLAQYMLQCGIGPRVHKMFAAYLCNKGIARSAAADDVAKLIDFDRSFPSLVYTHAVVAAAAEGRLNTLDWLRARGPLVEWPTAALTSAAANGRINILRWYKAHGFVIEEDPTLISISVCAQQDVVTKFLWPLYADRQENAAVLSAAISSSTVEMAHWMVSNCNIDVKVSMDRPAGRGDIEFLKWAQPRHPTATTHAMDDAASEGHLDVVVWLHATRSEGCTTSAMNKAASRGHFEVVQWLTINRLEGCSGEALFGAASSGRMDILLWLLKHWPRVSMPLATFDHVCARGHLDVARFLVTRKIGGGSHKAMDWAAGNNHVHMLEFLQVERREGCTTAAMNGAAGNGSLDALQWLATHRQEGCTTSAMDLAVYNDEIDAAKWLWEHRAEGCSSRAIKLAARRGNTEMMKWLEEKYPEQSSVRAIDAAIDSRDLECVKWCRQHRQEYASTDGVYLAVRQGSFSILEYLRMSGSSACATESFECAVDSRQLYLAAWIADNFPHAANHSYLESACHRNRWSKHIIGAAFRGTRVWNEVDSSALDDSDL